MNVDSFLKSGPWNFSEEMSLLWQTELRKCHFNYSETNFLEFLAGTFFSV